MTWKEMFRNKDKKTGVQTPELRKPTPPPHPPTSGSNAVKPNPNYIPPASTPRYNPPPMPPVNPPKENIIDTNHLRIKTLEAVRIEVNKNHLIASIEVAELQESTKVQVSTNSSSREDCNYKGDLFNFESLSWRDAFAPGATMYLVGIFEDWVSGELIYGEYDVLNRIFTRKDGNKCKD